MVFSSATFVVSRFTSGAMLTLTSQGMFIAVVDVLGSAKELVKTVYADWNQRRLLMAQREYMGYALQRRSGAMALETCDL